MSGQGGKAASQLQGISIPVRISGPLANLSYKPDLSDGIKASLKQEEAKIIDDVQDIVKQKAAELFGSPDGLDDAIQGLKGLFGR